MSTRTKSRHALGQEARLAEDQDREEPGLQRSRTNRGWKRPDSDDESREFKDSALKLQAGRHPATQADGEFFSPIQVLNVIGAVAGKFEYPENIKIKERCKSSPLLSTNLVCSCLLGPFVCVWGSVIGREFRWLRCWHSYPKP